MKGLNAMFWNRNKNQNQDQNQNGAGAADFVNANVPVKFNSVDFQRRPAVIICYTNENRRHAASS